MNGQDFTANFGIALGSSVRFCYCRHQDDNVAFAATEDGEEGTPLNQGSSITFFLLTSDSRDGKPQINGTSSCSPSSFVLFVFP